MTEAKSPFWLIERQNFGPSPVWYAETENGDHYWSSTAAEALPFTSRKEAEEFGPYQMIATDPDISIAEHQFVG
ncbi:hypothetical protein ELI01_18880 [Rhizobium leguminosarum]|uniref:hypothetical protein n=1 Tax=Rhizobium leguminosarum TaxID=384 RepID=UPI001030882C|nr:hypothetical protein [Rhizobium leguminosarum]TAX57143.1 hypothetical protein ELI01_18880 [Rhizobium leguminosarum]